MPSKAILDGAAFADYRQLTGVLAYNAYVYVKNKVVRSCDHRHRKATAAQACGARMLARYQREQGAPEMSREKPLYKEMMVFVKHHLANKYAFAPFTGQDWPAWMAFCYLLRCYAAGGGLAAIDAMRDTLFCAQHIEPVLQIFVQTIPGALDWGHVRELWPEVAGDLIIRGSHRLARHLVAYQRELDGKGIVAAYGIPRLEEVAGTLGKS